MAPRSQVKCSTTEPQGSQKEMSFEAIVDGMTGGPH